MVQQSRADEIGTENGEQMALQGHDLNAAPATSSTLEEEINHVQIQQSGGNNQAVIIHSIK